MKMVGSRELKNRLGRYLGIVRQGETVIVTDRGKAVAQLVPVDADSDSNESLDQLLKRLEEKGHLRVGTRPFKRVKPVRLKGKPVSQIIMEDRE